MHHLRAPFVFSATVVVVVVAVVGACTPSTSTDRESCAFTRIGSDDATAYSLVDDDAMATHKPAANPCGGATCLHVDPATAAIVQPDGSTWILEAGKEPRVEAAASATGSSSSAVAAAVSSRKTLGAPTLPAGFRTCGTVSAGGGYGFHVIQNDGSVWTRVAWVVPPTDPAVTALPTNAYPLALSSGPLCAWAEQASPRNWIVHHLASGKTIEAAKNREHVPAHCGAEGGVEVMKESGAVFVAADGSETPVKSVDVVANAVTEIELDGQTVINAPSSRISVVRKDRARAELPAALFADPVERLSTVGDGDHRLLVAVRARLADCATKETLWLVDTATMTPTPLVSADRVFTRLSFGAGRFWWVESQPKLVDTNG